MWHWAAVLGLQRSSCVGTLHGSFPRLGVIALGPRRSSRMGTSRAGRGESGSGGRPVWARLRGTVPYGCVGASAVVLCGHVRGSGAIGLWGCGGHPVWVRRGPGAGTRIGGRAMCGPDALGSGCRPARAVLGTHQTRMARTFNWAAASGPRLGPSGRDRRAGCWRRVTAVCCSGLIFAAMGRLQGLEFVSGESFCRARPRRPGPRSQRFVHL